MNETTGPAGPALGYVLGHTPFELDRLTRQARLIAPITRRYFVAAGIAPGMRVLDVGSGAGDVALLLADLVGPGGEVVGFDRAAPALATARARIAERGLKNVTFHEGDPVELGPGHGLDRPFDAVAGRYVLMFQRNPVPLLRGLAARLVPGGILVFHEPDWQAMHSNPPSPTYDRCRDWMVGLLRATGTESRMGVKLHAAYVEAGLPAPTMALEAGLGGAETGIEWIRLLTELVTTVVPELEKHGLATAAEVDAPTLVDRIVTELRAHDGAIVGRGEVGAWTRRGEA
jgi:SAM-dependent methyltransferase